MNLELILRPSNSEVAELYQKPSHYGNGFDLYIPEDIIIKPNSTEMINHQVSAMMLKNGMPVGYNLYARSSIGKRGLILTNSIGLIDDDYTGELGALVYNFTDEPAKLSKGERIVQVAASTLQRFKVTIVEYMPPTKRGAKGHGSTGL